MSQIKFHTLSLCCRHHWNCQSPPAVGHCLSQLVLGVGGMGAPASLITYQNLPDCYDEIHASWVATVACPMISWSSILVGYIPSSLLRDVLILAGWCFDHVWSLLHKFHNFHGFQGGNLYWSNIVNWCHCLQNHSETHSLGQPSSAHVRHATEWEMPKAVPQSATYAGQKNPKGGSIFNIGWIYVLMWF